MPVPMELNLLQKTKQLTILFDTQESFTLSCEYLRVHSPSAEVQGHHPTQKKLVLNKANVNITSILPVGRYAVKFVFDDGHASGIYTWDYLYTLCKDQQSLWQTYQTQVQAASQQGVNHDKSI